MVKYLEEQLIMLVKWIVHKFTYSKLGIVTLIYVPSHIEITFALQI